MIELSDQKEVALEVRATNLNGDDAYEASVVTFFPQSLTYSTFAVSPDVSPRVLLDVFSCSCPRLS